MIIQKKQNLCDLFYIWAFALCEHDDYCVTRDILRKAVKLIDKRVKVLDQPLFACSELGTVQFAIQSGIYLLYILLLY